MKKLFVVSLLLVLSLVAFSRVTITMTAGAVGKELEVLYAQIDRFMKANPDIKVSVMPMPNSSTERHDLYVTYLQLVKRSRQCSCWMLFGQRNLHRSWKI